MAQPGLFAAISDPRIQALLAGIAHGHGGGQPLDITTNPTAQDFAVPMQDAVGVLNRSTPPVPFTTPPAASPTIPMVGATGTAHAPLRPMLSSSGPTMGAPSGGRDATPPSTVGNPVGATPDLPPVPYGPDVPSNLGDLRSRASDLSRQAAEIGPAPIGHPKFNTVDLLAGLVPTLLLGRQGGNFAANFLGGKMNLAQEEQARQDRANDLQRSSLQNQASALYQAANTQDTNARYITAADIGANSRLGVAGVNAGAKEYGADVGLERTKASVAGRITVAQLTQESRERMARQVSMDKDASALLGHLADLPEEARPGFAETLTQNPFFAGLDASAIMAVGKQTEADKLKAAQAQTQVEAQARLRAQAGYLGAEERNLDNLSDARKSLLQSQAATQRSTSLLRMSQNGLATAQTVKIQNENSHYEQAFRDKADLVKSQIALNRQKAADSGSTPSPATQSALYRSQASIARSQAGRILTANGGQPPTDTGPNTPGRAAYLAYQQAMVDEQDAMQNIFRLGHPKAVLSPDNAGTPASSSVPAGSKAPATSASYASKIGGQTPFQYTGSNPNATVTTPNGKFTIAQLVEEANSRLGLSPSRRAGILAQLSAAVGGNVK